MRCEPALMQVGAGFFMGYKTDRRRAAAINELLSEVRIGVDVREAGHGPYLPLEPGAYFAYEQTF